jgi:hypothetical protein
LIGQAKADSLTTARALQEIDRRVRALDGELDRERRALVAAIDRELAAGSEPGRRGKLVAARRDAARALHHDKKIVLPDDTIDPLADPEELEDQAALIAQSEKDLAREIQLLTERASRYRHMEKLRQQRARAAEAGRWDDSRSRRPSGRSGDRQTGGAGTLEDADGDAPPASVDDPGFNAGVDYSDPTVVLVEVVDTDTLDALRSAQSSTDLTVKAKAAERASREVQGQLERLRRQRLLIEKRAAELRR